MSKYVLKRGIMKAEGKNSELGTLKKRLRNDSEVSEEYYNVLKDKFSHGSEFAKKAFNKFVPNDSVVDSSYEGIPIYDPDSKKIKMHYGADLINARGPGATWFHEHGHLIDSAAGLLSNNPKYLELLRNDYNNYINNYAINNNISIQQAYRDIGSELSEMRTHSAISDLMNVLSNDKIKGVAWHPRSYWENDELISSEAFAHMFEAQFDDIRYVQIKKYFPESLKLFETLLKEAII